MTATIRRGHALLVAIKDLTDEATGWAPWVNRQLHHQMHLTLPRVVMATLY